MSYDEYISSALQENSLYFLGVAVGNSTYGKPRRAIHFNNVYCTGNEDSILDCSYHQYLLDEGKVLTDHAEVHVVGVSCSHDIMTTVSGTVMCDYDLNGI